MILAIEQALQQNAPADLSAPERVVLALEALEREVNDGGYNQFFLNEPSYAHEIVAALNEIGCPDAARITRDMTDDEMAKLYPLDEEFFAYPDPISERLMAFIRANGAEIRL